MPGWNYSSRRNISFRVDLVPSPGRVSGVEGGGVKGLRVVGLQGLGFKGFLGFKRFGFRVCRAYGVGLWGK